MANKLKIYACSGVGEKPIGTENVRNVSYDTLGTNTLTNTQAVNSLLSRINYARTNSKRIDISEAERINYYNEIDLYSVCLNYVIKYAQDSERLSLVGIAIGVLLNFGAFSCNSTEDADREANLRDIYKVISDCVSESSLMENYVRNSAFEAWWENEIVARNVVYLSSEEAQQITNRLDQSLEKISGIGDIWADWHKDKDVSTLLTKASEHFLYIYFNSSELNQLPEVFRKKRKKQFETYYFVRDRYVGIYGTQEDLDRVIADGITQYFGVSPRSVCKDILDGKRSIDGIGQLDPLTIVMIITACVNVIIAITQAICSAVATSEEVKYQTLREETIKQAQATSGDFEDWSFDGSSGSEEEISLLGVNFKKKWIAPIVFCIAGLWWIKNND